MNSQLRIKAPAAYFLAPAGAHRLGSEHARAHKKHQCGLKSAPLACTARTRLPRSTRAQAAENSAMHKHVGFLGLGIMGEAMARNLLKSGQYESITVWNRTPDKVLPAALAPQKAYTT